MPYFVLNAEKVRICEVNTVPLHSSCSSHSPLGQDLLFGRLGEGTGCSILPVITIVKSLFLIIFFKKKKLKIK
jgi:hypothetical protein